MEQSSEEQQADFEDSNPETQENLWPKPTTRPEWTLGSKLIVFIVTGTLGLFFAMFFAIILTAIF